MSQEQLQQQAAQNAAFAGYPALMRQYLQQQQGAQMAAMMGGMGGGNPMMMGMGDNGMGMGGGGDFMGTLTFFSVVRCWRVG